MIHLPLKQRDQVPARLSVNGALRQIKRAYNGTSGEEYNASYYPHEQVIGLLKAYSIHKTAIAPGDQPKCNYCESRIEHAATLQVEHYRPKAKVESGENDHIETRGYYWLGLEWTNLLLACPKCNGKDAKGNKFPIRGVRAQPHNPVLTTGRNLSLVRLQCYANGNPLRLELPILLNPELDHPENCLTFDAIGSIGGYGNDVERGEMSKDIYRLNRDELLICRQRVWDEIKNDINEDVGGHQASFLDDQALRFRFGVTAKKLLKRKLADQEYTLWGRYLNNNLPNFLGYLGPYYSNLFLDAYNEIVAQNP
ncbi:MAG: hypothetical protein V4663_16265 [Bacteroidota bacterium]